MSGQFWWAVAAYVLPTFPLGYFWHLSTFKKRYDALEIYREKLLFPLGLTAMLVQGAIFSWAYPRLFDISGDAWVASGLKAALVFGVLAWTFSTLAVGAKNKMRSPGEFIVLESAFTAVHFLVVGPLIALAWRQGA